MKFVSFLLVANSVLVSSPNASDAGVAGIALSRVRTFGSRFFFRRTGKYGSMDDDNHDKRVALMSDSVHEKEHPIETNNQSSNVPSSTSEKVQNTDKNEESIDQYDKRITSILTRGITVHLHKTVETKDSSGKTVGVSPKTIKYILKLKNNELNEDYKEFTLRRSNTNKEIRYVPLSKVESIEGTFFESTVSKGEYFLVFKVNSSCSDSSDIRVELNVTDVELNVTDERGNKFLEALGRMVKKHNPNVSITQHSVS